MPEEKCLFYFQSFHSSVGNILTPHQEANLPIRVSQKDFYYTEENWSKKIHPKNFLFQESCFKITEIIYSLYVTLWNSASCEDDCVSLCIKRVNSYWRDDQTVSDLHFVWFAKRTHGQTHPWTDDALWWGPKVNIFSVTRRYRSHVCPVRGC